MGFRNYERKRNSAYNLNHKKKEKKTTEKNHLNFTICLDYVKTKQKESRENKSKKLKVITTFQIIIELKRKVIIRSVI